LQSKSSIATAPMPSDRGDNVTVLEAVAETWNRAGINYAVAHGLEGYPARTGRDLDVLVQSDQIDAALGLAEGILLGEAWTVAHPPAIWGKRLIAASSSKKKGVLEVHTVSAVTCWNVSLANHPVPTDWIGPFKVDPWVSLAKRVLAPLLSGGVGRFVAKPEEFGATENELQMAAHQLDVLLGSDLALALVRSLRYRDLESVRPLIPRMRRSAILRGGIQHPIRSFRLLSKSIGRKCLQPLNPCAPVIAVVGPDGVGKSTALRDLQHSDGHIFLDVIVRHWRPGVLPPLAKLAGRSTPRPGPDGSFPPRRQPGRFHAVRLFYYYLDFLIGGFIRDRIDSSRQRLVLYDRCFLDAAVDPVRYGLASSRGTDFCWRWLPQPDRIILLTDEPHRIYARKAELPELEIARQLDEWHRRAKAGQVHAVIPVGASREQVTDAIWHVIRDAFFEMNRRESAGVRSARFNVRRKG
jgi:hypothetical protein